MDVKPIASMYNCDECMYLKPLHVMPLVINLFLFLVTPRENLQI